MNEFLSYREELLDKPLHFDPKDEAGIYNENQFPKSVREFGNKVETVVGKLLEEAGDDLAYVNDEIKTRSEGPVVLIPQSKNFHEFDVLTHIDVTAWAAYNYKETIYPNLDNTLRYDLESILENSPIDIEETLAMAAYLHDIEKVFYPQRSRTDQSLETDIITERVPYYSKPGKESQEVELLGENDKLLLGDVTPKQAVAFRENFANLVLFGVEVQDEAQNTTLNELNGVLKDVVEGKNVMATLNMYNFVDSLVINAHKRGATSFEVEEEMFSKHLNENGISEDMAVLGILCAMSDNFAQGNPKNPDARFEPQQIRANEMYKTLLGNIVKK